MLKEKKQSAVYLCVYTWLEKNTVVMVKQFFIRFQEKNLFLFYLTLYLLLEHPLWFGLLCDFCPVIMHYFMLELFVCYYQQHVVGNALSGPLRVGSD